jgi:hypothetical protein
MCVDIRGVGSEYDADSFQTFHALTIRESEMQKQAKKDFEEAMRRGTVAKPGLLEKSMYITSRCIFLLKAAVEVLPTWSVFCRRLTPCEGYLEALCADNVSTPCTILG